MSPPWMPLYIGDYLADTAHLKTAEHGAYLLLIMHYWRTGGLPKDDASLARIARMTMPEWRRARDVIAGLFDDDWTHKRVEFELTEAARISEAGRRGGKASGAARKSKTSNKSNTETNDRSTTVERSANDQATIREALPSQSQSLREETTEADASVERAKRASRLPEDWGPSQADNLFAMQFISEPQVPFEIDKFRDHWRAANGPPSVKRDWSAAWRNWCRNSVKFSGNGNGQHRENGGRRGGARGFSGLAFELASETTEHD